MKTHPKLSTPSDLSEKGREELAKDLNLLVADVFTLYLKSKNFHWHVSGCHFRDLHLLFDEQADQIFAMSDTLAERARKLGSFSYFYSCMTQRKEQLETFRAWAGISSDISYYLNSHHIDVHCWMLEDMGSKPIQVVAASSSGLANSRLDRTGVEDTISIMVLWSNADGSTGHATYMSSWIAPKADCHTQQNFHYVGHEGEIRVDQAHRGYYCSASEAGNGTGALAAINPLYMR